MSAVAKREAKRAAGCTLTVKAQVHAVFQGAHFACIHRGTATATHLGMTTHFMLCLALALQSTEESVPPRRDVPTVQAISPRPRLIPASPNEQPPPGYRAATQPNIPLVATGGGVFLATWALSSLVLAPSMYFGSGTCSVFSSDGCSAVPIVLGIIPVAGPILMSLTLEYRQGIYFPWAIASSGIQLAGLGIAIAGFIWPKPIWVLEKSATQTPVQLSLAGQGLQLRF